MAVHRTDLPPGIKRYPIQRFVTRGRPSVWEHETRRTLDLGLRRSDVFHNLNPHAPIWPPQPWIQTLYDVIPLLSDDPAEAVLKRRFQRFGPRYAKANAVIAISRHAADDGIRHLGVDPRRMHVVHPGLSGGFSPGNGRDREGPPYLTVVSEYSRRKGFRESFEVIAALADSGYPHRLAVVGRVRRNTRSEFEAFLSAARRRDRIDVLGFVDTARLVSLYRGAEVHLITSRYEGFGLSALEAMACGTPVVAFDNTSLPEVVGDGGILVPDGDVSAAAKAVRSVIESPEQRADLSQRALAQAAKFNWEDAASQHAEIYRSVF